MKTVREGKICRNRNNVTALDKVLLFLIDGNFEVWQNTGLNVGQLRASVGLVEAAFM